MNGPEAPSFCGSSHRTTFSAWYAPDTASLKLAVLSPQLTTWSNTGPMNSASPVLSRPPGPRPVLTEPVVAAVVAPWVVADAGLVTVPVPVAAVGWSPPRVKTTISTVAIATAATSAAISNGSLRLRLTGVDGSAPEIG